MLFLPLFLVLFWTAWAGTLTVDVLDVGQGDSILLRSPAGKAVLIDAGEEKNDVAEQLRALGVTELAMAVATHPHADHIGGMNAVLQAIPAKLYLDSGLPHTTATYSTLMQTVEQKGIPYKSAAVGQSYTLDGGIRLTVLGPESSPVRGSRSDLNANSVVIRVTNDQDCLLLVGDAELETEARLLEAGVQPCEVLKVAHHGSNFASSEAFLRAVKPKIALISVGEDNRYGHPGEEAVARLSAAGATIYRTDRDGGLRLQSTGKGWTIATQVASPPLPSPAPASAVTSTSAPPASAPPTSGTSASVEPATASPVDSTCAFVASVNSRLFHGADCPTARRISAATRVCYAAREDAEAAGRTPAQDCSP